MDQHISDYKVPFINYGLQYQKIKPEIDKAIQSCLERGDLILRKDVKEFEEKFANYIGVKYAVGVNSGTDALYLALKALKIKGRVALPSHTFKATCGAVVSAGLEPVIYDMDGIIKGELCDAHIPVHIAGEISLIPKLGIPIIEDACQAIGAIKNPTSDVQCWSFYPAKILGAFGDAGGITTNREDVYEYIKEARNHFKTDNRELGGNYRMDNIQASILNCKMQYLDGYIKRRQEIADMYYEGLKELEERSFIKLPNKQKGRVYQNFVIQVFNKKRDQLFEFLRDNGIECLKNEYPFSPKYPKLPLAAKYEAETLRLPISENISNEEVIYVIKQIQQFFRK